MSDADHLCVCAIYLLSYIWERNTYWTVDPEVCTHTHTHPCSGLDAALL